jgi:ribosomal protein S18 acetylase RimI-like enzyme
MSVMVLVREITADEWELMRDVRLAALAEAPYAYASTYAGEAGFTEADWRGRINERSAMFLAYTDADPGPAGLAGVYVKDGAAHLVSVWVRPAARGLRVGETLVEAAVSWAKAQDFATISLWVTESNTPARRLYDRCGFTPTGERQPLPSDPTLPEIVMSRAL